jgi:hypothetical protein
LFEKNKTILELKERISQLEKRMEIKDCELIESRDKITAATVRLEERDK